MKKTLARWLDNIWYKDHFIGTWLMPFSMLFMDAVRFRRWMYKKGYKPVSQVPVPVIIVGNITLGGTGKTPLVIYLVQQLQAAGFKPGVISRGYGGKSEHWPQMVTVNSDVNAVGDEPLLIAQQTGVPIAVGPMRGEAAEMLLKNAACDVILSDDGLQHYALHRDIEIVVIDGERRFGNNFCLPSGPLREPQERIREVDFIVCNGEQERLDGEILMTLLGTEAVNIKTGAVKPLSAFKNLSCHALAGIGCPQRFFSLLSAQGLTFTQTAFPDHHRYSAKELRFKSAEAILMTEKDAVKCGEIASDKHWFVPVVAKVEAELSEQLIALLRTKISG